MGDPCLELSIVFISVYNFAKLINVVLLIKLYVNMAVSSLEISLTRSRTVPTDGSVSSESSLLHIVHVVIELPQLFKKFSPGLVVMFDIQTEIIRQLRQANSLSYF